MSLSHICFLLRLLVPILNMKSPALRISSRSAATQPDNQLHAYHSLSSCALSDHPASNCISPHAGKQMHFPTCECSCLCERARSAAAKGSDPPWTFASASVVCCAFHSAFGQSIIPSAYRIVLMQHTDWVQACNASFSRSSSVSRQANGAGHGVAVSRCTLPLLRF